jgi:hypothetical protein
LYRYIKGPALEAMAAAAAAVDAQLTPMADALLGEGKSGELIATLTSAAATLTSAAATAKDQAGALAAKGAGEALARAASLRDTAAARGSGGGGAPSAADFAAAAGEGFAGLELPAAGLCTS